MQLLKEIKDAPIPQDESNIKVRKAVRAILFDENNQVPLLFSSKYNYYKIPGGGIDLGETKQQALIRECHEEIGCDIEVQGEVGKIIEFRSKWDMKQISYCYYGKITKKAEPNFTPEEIEQGFEVVWMPFEEALNTINNDVPLDKYLGEFVKQRDLVLFNKVKEIINK